MGILDFLAPDPVKLRLPAAGDALPGRPGPIVRPGTHTVLGTPIDGPFPDGTVLATFALGCFWGAEKGFWQIPGVFTTAVGYAGGSTPKASQARKNTFLGCAPTPGITQLGMYSTG